MRTGTADEAAFARARWALFGLGVALSLFLLPRGVLGGDQLNLLARGWLLAARHVLIPFGNPLSTRGDEPGPLTSLLVGAPMFLWRDYRAPVTVILACHVGAFLILDRTLAQVLSPRGRLLFAAIYWMNPARVYHSGYLWNPHYLLLPAAVHFWSAWKQRTSASWWATFLHVLALGFAGQLHVSVVLLAVLSIVLWWRGYMRVHWGGFALGLAVVAASLVPWALSFHVHPEAFTATRGVTLLGLRHLTPLLQGAGHWVRYGSFSLQDRFLSRLDFGPTLGPSIPPLVARVVGAVLIGLGWVTILVPLVGNLRLWHARRPGFARRCNPDATPLEWLRGVIGWTFASMLVSLLLTPTDVMYWQLFILLHAAVLPTVLFLDEVLAWLPGPSLRAVIAGLVAYSTAAIIAAGLGAPQFRHGGYRDLSFPLAHSSPMFADLGIDRHCPFPLDVPGGWWPDVLPPE